jgi:hypothetical protein
MCGASGVFPRLLVGAYVETCRRGRNVNSTCGWSLSPDGCTFLWPCARRDGVGRRQDCLRRRVRVVTYSLDVPRGACPHAQPSVRPSAALGDRCAVAGAVAREDARRRAGAQRTGGKHMLLLLRWRFHVAEARGRSKVAVAGVVVDDTEARRAPSPGRFGVSGAGGIRRGRACRTRRSGAPAKCTCTLAPRVVSVRTWSSLEVTSSRPR